MTISALPTPPSRSDSANFATRADAWNAAMVQMRTEYNALELANLTQGTEATAAKNAAIAAWAASTSPAEQLAAFSTTLHSGAIVKAIIYDTSKDSDGGAWRKRCQSKSWYTEDLGGTVWLGRAATAAAGWALPGAVTGAYFQNTTDGKFYTLGASSPTVTECFRGNAREFPQQVAVIAESGRVVIYDLTQTGCPMWIVFKGGGTNNNNANLIGASTILIKSVAALNGLLLVGEGVSWGVSLVSFITDSSLYYFPNYRVSFGQIVDRNSGKGYSAVNGATVIMSAAVNDCAITALDSAPIDPATGLPTPTIYVFTAGGVSRIAHDGTVSSTASTTVTSGAITESYVFGNSNAGSAASFYPLTSALPAGGGLALGDYWGYFFASSWSSVRMAQALGGFNSNVLAPSAFGGSLGLQRAKTNFKSPQLSLIAAITKDYNSGWMPGDIRGAYLADTVAETITASGELVTNGDFATNTSGWTTGNSASLSAAGALLTVTNGAAQSGYAYQAVTVVVGKTYVVQWTAATGTSQAYRRIGTVIDGTQYFSEFAANNTSQVSFTATTTTAYITLGVSTATAGLNATFDNISVKLAEPDRSVKNKGLVVNGTLTKAAAASGAGLVAYSGFSASNYLEQPYNSDLDFGTGDFCVMGWVNVTSVSVQQIFDRGSAAAGRIGIYMSPLWGINCSASAASISTGVTATTGLQLVCLYRTSGVLKFNINGVEIYSAANTENVSNALAPTTFGASYLKSSPIPGSLALWRITATAPSADQIAHIYRTELPLFQANAQCTIAGTSNVVTALAYDDAADLLHVGTSYGRTSFNNLLRVDSEATTTGALTSLAANQGAVLSCGTSGKFYQPSMLLRDELRRRDEARRALGRVPVFFDYTATASQTAFVLPKGYTARALYKNGTLMRETTTGTYWTRSTDGFAETATLSVGASVSDWISIMAVRQ